MDYERIRKAPQGGGGFSPAKLRTMLLGVERKRKEEEQLDSSTLTSRSQASDADETGGCISDHCKDVDVVSVLDHSASTIAHSFVSKMVANQNLKDNVSITSRDRIHDNPVGYDSGNVIMNVSSSMFEFQKGERAAQRTPLAPFSKPAPSKWDDAQKWIVSPTSNRPKAGQTQAQGELAGACKMSAFGYGSRQPSMKVISEVPDQKAFAFEEPDTKRIDTNQTCLKSVGQKFGSWDGNPYPLADSYVNLSQHSSSVSIQSAATFIPPPSTARSVSMRDMGTEMTPLASQEPSRTGTPVRATTPLRSPTSSRPSTPGRSAPASTLYDPPNDPSDTNYKDLSQKELQMKTRREIIALGTQLGKMNIAAWASKEEDAMDASTSLNTLATEQPAKSVIETRAAAWEEAEKAKYMARFKREEMKIQAWENHQKAKTEAEMRKIEVEVERMRGHAHDKLMNKLAAARHKAEDKRAAAEAKRNRRAAKTEEQAEYIRRTGRVPSFTCCGWCS